MPQVSFPLPFACRYDFPDPLEADPDGIGLVAMGGDLAPDTLLSAYAQGLFPWFNDDEPIAWWCPEPRCVIDPTAYQPSKSLKRQVKHSAWHWSVNQDFSSVIRACSLPRSYANDTWIHEDMITAYTELHHAGYAHSIEVWQSADAEQDTAERQLIGGLYGLKIGAVFFGESMFHHQTNASKVAFWALTHLCAHTGVQLIDCQLPNDHLLSLGAQIMPRKAFLTVLNQLIAIDTAWQTPAYITASKAGSVSLPEAKVLHAVTDLLP